MVVVNPENATIKYPTSYEPVLPALGRPAPMPAIAIGPLDPLAPPAMPALPMEELPAAMVPPGVGQVAEGSVRTSPTSDVRNRGDEDNDIGTVTTADYDEEDDEEDEDGMYGAQHNHSYPGHEHFCSQPSE